MNTNTAGERVVTKIDQPTGDRTMKSARRPTPEGESMKLADLSGRWRDEAELYRRRGQERLASMVESLAADLEEFARQADLEELTIQEAAVEAGQSYSSIQKRIASGDIPNVGRKHRPRVMRRDIVADVLVARRQAG